MKNNTWGLDTVREVSWEYLGDNLDVNLTLKMMNRLESILQYAKPSQVEKGGYNSRSRRWYTVWSTDGGDIPEFRILRWPNGGGHLSRTKTVDECSEEYDTFETPEEYKLRGMRWGEIARELTLAGETSPDMPTKWSTKEKAAKENAEMNTTHVLFLNEAAGLG